LSHNYHHTCNCKALSTIAIFNAYVQHNHKDILKNKSLIPKFTLDIPNHRLIHAWYKENNETSTGKLIKTIISNNHLYFKEVHALEK